MAAEEQTRLAVELDFYAAHKAEWLKNTPGNTWWSRIVMSSVSTLHSRTHSAPASAH